MPDPKQMSGVPLPVGDVPVGTVTVRVIRGSLPTSSPARRSSCRRRRAARPRRPTTQGRAEFTGLAPGTRVKASTTVDGERLESQEFAVPAAGGVRLMLVATDPGASETAAPAERPPALPQAPAQPGTVVLGDQIALRRSRWATRRSTSSTSCRS